MPKKKPEIRMHSYGIYTKWERGSKALPKLLKITDRIPAEIDIEFGYVLEIKKAKGKRIDFVIEHPPFLDDSGKVSPPFEGEYYVNTNDYRFFLGDCIWAPIDDKKGPWRITAEMDGEIIADKTLMVE